jgi:antitoxin CptB
VTPEIASDTEYARLRWRCRRGMLELDLLLDRFLTARYHDLDTAERAAFSRLLDLPDPELLTCLSGKAEPADPELRALVQRLR